MEMFFLALMAIVLAGLAFATMMKNHRLENQLEDFELVSLALVEAEAELHEAKQKLLEAELDLYDLELDHEATQNQLTQVSEEAATLLTQNLKLATALVLFQEQTKLVAPSRTVPIEFTGSEPSAAV